MNDSDEHPVEPDFVGELKQRMLRNIIVRMEGTLNRESAEDIRMFDELFDELLSDEKIILSRNERQRLYEALLSAF